MFSFFQNFFNVEVKVGDKKKEENHKDDWIKEYEGDVEKAKKEFEEKFNDVQRELKPLKLLKEIHDNADSQVQSGITKHVPIDSGFPRVHELEDAYSNFKLIFKVEGSESSLDCARDCARKGKKERAIEWYESVVRSIKDIEGDLDRIREACERHDLVVISNSHKVKKALDALYNSLDTLDESSQDES